MGHSERRKSRITGTWCSRTDSAFLSVPTLRLEAHHRDLRRRGWRGSPEPQFPTPPDPLCCSADSSNSNPLARICQRFESDENSCAVGASKREDIAVQTERNPVQHSRVSQGESGWTTSLLCCHWLYPGAQRMGSWYEEDGCWIQSKSD